MSFWFYLTFTYPFKAWVLRRFFANEVSWIKDDAVASYQAFMSVQGKGE